MPLSKHEIGAAKTRLAATGWLSQSSAAFREALLAECRWVEIDPPDSIALNAEDHDGIYGVATGNVGVFSAIGVPGTGLLHIANAPFWFGLAPFVTHAGRQVTVQARSRCTVACISQLSITRVVKSEAEGWRMLALQAVQASALAVQVASELVIPDSGRRCGAVLLRLAGVRQKDHDPHEIACSQEELAAMCNLSRQTTALILRRFDTERLVSLSYRSIRVLKPDQLWRMIESS